jgi:hypothetical protein
MMNLPIAAYVRVSTPDPHPEAQLQEVRGYAARRNVELVEFVDHGTSGRKDRRQALDALMQSCRAREVSAVVVVRLDRVARSLVHMAKLGEEMDSLGIELVSPIGLIEQAWTADRGANDRKVNPRFRHLAQDLVFHRVERDRFSADVKLQIFPDVVAPQSWGVVTNAGRWELAKNPADSHRVVGVDPIRQSRLSRRGRLAARR